LTPHLFLLFIGKGGKNRRRGKGDGEESKRELEFKEDGTLQTFSQFQLCVCVAVTPQKKPPSSRLYDYKNVINFTRDSGEYKATLFVEKYT
jgi:hypothetical protein